MEQHEQRGLGKCKWFIVNVKYFKFSMGIELVKNIEVQHVNRSSEKYRWKRQ